MYILIMFNVTWFDAFTAFVLVWRVGRVVCQTTLLLARTPGFTHLRIFPQLPPSPRTIP